MAISESQGPSKSNTEGLVKTCSSACSLQTNITIGVVLLSPSSANPKQQSYQYGEVKKGFYWLGIPKSQRHQCDLPLSLFGPLNNETTLDQPGKLLNSLTTWAGDNPFALQSAWTVAARGTK